MSSPWRSASTIVRGVVDPVTGGVSLQVGGTVFYPDAFVETIGRTVPPIDGIAAAGGNFLMANPATAGPSKITLTFLAKATGTVKLSKYTKSGSTFTRVAVASKVITSTGQKTLTSSDFGGMTFSASEYPAIEGEGIWTYSINTADGSGWWQIAAGATSATVGAPLTSARLEVGFRLSQDTQVFNTALIQSLNRVASNQTSAVRPVFLVVDGNSIAAGEQSSPLYRPSDGVASSMSITAVNLAVSGQTTQQMTADAVAQVDPYALTAGVLPILIAQEIFNDIRVNSITVAQAVTNIATYCNARRAAGFKVGVCNLADMEPTGGFTAGMVAAVNAELAIRWWTFADFLVDLYAAGELKDRTNTTYFQADKVHNTNAGYAVMARQTRLAIRQFLLTL